MRKERGIMSLAGRIYLINALLEDGKGYAELQFEPKADLKFLGFIFKRIA